MPITKAEALKHLGFIRSALTMMNEPQVHKITSLADAILNASRSVRNLEAAFRELLPDSPDTVPLGPTLEPFPLHPQL